MPWMSNGLHATVNLKCGHVFGKSCIHKYIKESLAQVKYSKCPVCDASVTKSEPRRIWPSKVVPCSEDDLRELKKEHEEADATLQTLLEKKLRIDNEIQQIKEELNKYQSTEMLKKKMNSQNEATEHNGSQPEINRRYTLQHTFSMSNEKYRVSDLVLDRDMAVLSVANNMSNTFGIRKVNLFDPSLTEFIPNHTAQIKDVKQGSSNNIILSTGFDKTLKLTSIATNQVVLTYKLDAPGWSCASNHSDPNLVYCGVTNNKLLVFDIRNTKGCVQTLMEPGPNRNMSPIHCVESFDNKILCSNLSHSYYWYQNNPGEYAHHPINEFADSSDNTVNDFKNFGMTLKDEVLLTSLRSKNSCNYSIAHFQENELCMDWKYENVNQQQKSMPRNTVYKVDGEVYLCYADNNMVQIRNKDNLIQSITTDNQILDIKYNQKQRVLTVLMENYLQVYNLTQL